MSSSKKSQTQSNEPELVEESIYTLMTKMAVGEKIVVPIEAWDKVLRLQPEEQDEQAVYRKPDAHETIKDGLPSCCQNQVGSLSLVC